MPKDICITELDQKRLQDILDGVIRSGKELDPSMRKLQSELRRATVVGSRQVPGDIITMNSRALLEMEQEEVEISLTYPDDADWSTGRMSILSPVGTAILGYKAGDEVHWEVPSGVTTIRIKELLYQPEAAGDYHL